jgi:hypothetical protein
LGAPQPGHAGACVAIRRPHAPHGISSAGQHADSSGQEHHLTGAMRARKPTRRGKPSGESGRTRDATDSLSSSTTSWEERVPVVITTYEMWYECKHCRAVWTEEKVEQVEDFDIPRG